MLTRRELIASGVAGGLTPPLRPAEEQDADRNGQREIAKAIGGVEEVLRNAHLSSSLSHGFATKLRADMEQFLRANSKFPDYVDVGVGVFFDLYDWHVKNGQQLNVTRLADGRYAMQFMFSTMILSPAHDRTYIGVPYDRI
jgi:hypothetical protein